MGEDTQCRIKKEDRLIFSFICFAHSDGADQAFIRHGAAIIAGNPAVMGIRVHQGDTARALSTASALARPLAI